MATVKDESAVNRFLRCRIVLLRRLGSMIYDGQRLVARFTDPLDVDLGGQVFGGTVLTRDHGLVTELWPSGPNGQTPKLAAWNELPRSNRLTSY